MHPLPPPTQPLSWPLKLVTLLFSGSVATMAIARAGLAGCGAAPPAQAPAKPPLATPTPVDGAALPVQAPAGPPPPSPMPVEIAAPPAPEPTPTVSLGSVEDALPEHYLGGAKSDDDIWVPARAKPDQPAKQQAQQPTQRGQR